jgi:NAD+ kinase
MPLTPESQQIIALVVRHNTAGIDEPVQAIVDFLQGAGYRVVFERNRRPRPGPGVESMTVGEIGEQATGHRGRRRRHHARHRAPAGAYEVPLIGINQGRLGFMTDIPLDRMLPVLGEILERQGQAEERTLLEGRVMRDGVEIHCGVASTTWSWRAAAAPAWPSCASRSTAISCTTSARTA